MSNVGDINYNAYTESSRDSPVSPQLWDVDEPFTTKNKESMSVADNPFFKKYARPHITRRGSSGRAESESDQTSYVSHDNTSNDDEQIEYRPGSGFVHKLMSKFQRASSLENLLDGEHSPRHEKHHSIFSNQSTKSNLSTEKSQSVENILNISKPQRPDNSVKIPVKKDTKHKESHIAPDLAALGRTDIVIIEHEPLSPTSATGELPFTDDKNKSDLDRSKYGDVRSLRDETESVDELPKPNTVSSTRSLFETEKSGDVIKPKWRKTSSTAVNSYSYNEVGSKSKPVSKIEPPDANTFSIIGNISNQNDVSESSAQTTLKTTSSAEVVSERVEKIPPIRKDRPNLPSKDNLIFNKKPTTVVDKEIDSEKLVLTSDHVKNSVTETSSHTTKTFHPEPATDNKQSSSSVLFDNAKLIYSSDDVVKKPPKRKNKENMRKLTEKQQRALTPPNESSSDTTPPETPRGKSRAPLPGYTKQNISSTNEFNALDSSDLNSVRDKNDLNSRLKKISVEPPTPREQQKNNYSLHSSSKPDDQMLNHAQESTLENGEMVNSISHLDEPERGVPTIIAKRRQLKEAQQNGIAGIETNSSNSMFSKGSSYGSNTQSSSQNFANEDSTKTKSVNKSKENDSDEGRPNYEDFIAKRKGGLTEVYTSDVQSKPKNNVPRLDLSGINDKKEKTAYSRRKIEPCKFIVIGGNIVDSPILKSKKRHSKQKGNITFNEEEISTKFFYLSEESSLKEYLQEHPEEKAIVEKEQLILDGFDPVGSESSDDSNESSDFADTPRNGVADDTSALKSNTTLGSGDSLSSYKPKLQQDFTFGMSLYEADRRKIIEPEPQPVTDDDSMELTPADDAITHSWSALSTTDSLF